MFQFKNKILKYFYQKIYKKVTVQSVTPADLIHNLKFCVFDLETTGGNFKMDKIIEIGLVKIENLQITEKRNFLIQPGIKIPEFIQRLTSIDHEDVGGAPTIEDVIDEIVTFIGDSIVVAHNISFDLPFLNSELHRLGRKRLKNKGICTNLMTRYLIPNLLHSNLHYMSTIFNITHKKAHRALDDAHATADLLLIYLNIFLKKDIKKINHLYYPQNKYELNRIYLNYLKDTIEDIEVIVRKIKIPFLITVKGQKGVLQYVLPVQGRESEYQFLLKTIGTIQWRTIAITIIGPFLEAVIQFSSSYTRLKPKMRAMILDFLWKTHLSSIQKEIRPRKDLENSFFILQHLVKGQFIIYPTSPSYWKKRLIFKHPGNEKKLKSYVRLRMKPSPQESFDRMTLLIYSLLQKEYMLTGEEILDHTKETFEKFSKRNSSDYGYPHHYLY